MVQCCQTELFLSILQSKEMFTAIAEGGYRAAASLASSSLEFLVAAGSRTSSRH